MRSFLHNEHTTLTALVHLYIFTYIDSVLQGYDMEDAFILNKGSFERGFAHGSVLKTEVSLLSSI